MADLTHPKLVVLLVAAFLVVAAAWIAVLVFRWRRITWRDHMDTQIAPEPRDVRESGPWAVWKTFTQHDEVAQPSLVLLRIRNSGFRAISQADVQQPLTLTFPGRVVKEFTVTDCRGVARQQIQPPGDLNAPLAAENQIALPSFPMRRKAGFKLFVLLSGVGSDIVVQGRLRRGSVIHESRVRGPLAVNVAFGAVLLLLLGVQAGITFGQTSSQPSYCGSGQLALEGSTAFAPTAQMIGSAYSAACRGAAVSVSGIATFNGLNAVAASVNPDKAAASGASPQAAVSATPAAAGGTVQMAMSDGEKPAGYPSLYGQPVAVILFAVVVNRATGVLNLSTAQLRGIFDGRITNWKQVGGANLPVSIVARASGSGTRRAFDLEILGGAEPAASSYNCVSKNELPRARAVKCEVSDTGTLLQRVASISGAVGYAQVSDANAESRLRTIAVNGWAPTFDDAKAGSYPFWTVEWLYTAGAPPEGSLAADFLGYIAGTTAAVTLYHNDYTPCVDRGRNLLKTMCSPTSPEAAS
ncbi:MAG TPA: substrate-binding domain-containing protein [Trebonia sp.]